MQKDSNTIPAEIGTTATSDGSATSAIITVVHDPLHPLGKRFDLKVGGTVSKISNVSVSFGIAVMHRVETHGEFSALLTKVGDDPHAAIINASFNGIEIGEEFAILSGREIEKRLGIPTSDRERQKGVHQIDYDGKTMKAVGRFKENVRASSWQLLDRDNDEHTPAQFAHLTGRDWLSELAKIIPGVDTVTYVETPSTSSRVLLNGKPVGGSNGHVWVNVKNPLDVERARAAVIVLAAQADMTWTKPRFSRAEEGKVVGQSLAMIIDPSVWTPGRLVFDGKPTVGDGFTVAPLLAVVHQGECNALDTSAIVLPDVNTVREVTRKAGLEMNVKADGAGLRITANNLKFETEIETEDHGILTVRELVGRGITGKIRCQTPFRDSTSYAAFYSTNADGIPFVYDSGTGITHWLNQFEAEDVKLIKAHGVVEKLIKTVKDDSAAVLEENAVEALAVIKQDKPADYQRKRSELKSINQKVPLTDMDRMVKARVAEFEVAPTHHGYAKRLLSELIEKSYRPVGHHGDLYSADPETGLWLRNPFEKLVHRVADSNDGDEHCQTSSDYRAIASHAISLASDEHYFTDAPIGIACKGVFYQIVDDQIVTCKLTPEHRQRVMLDFKPEAMPTPLFEAFLHETFASKIESEETQQIALVQEIAGAIMLGLMPRHQKAVLFYDMFGRAGKGTLERCLRGLVPKEFVAAVSPFSWGKDYFVAALAGARLNVVGELPDNESIPAAMFKTVLGGDLITGRHPTHRPITFSNEAAHVFMSNHLINTRDHSEAFFARWLIIEFPNSRLRTGLPLDPMLADRIVQNEMPGIAYWAMEGAARLVGNSAFSKSSVHDRLMARWRCTSNSLEEFIDEECQLLLDSRYRRSEFYRDYTEWCKDNGRKPFAKGRVKELLEHNIGMGIRLVESNGYETFVGIGPKPTPTSKPSAATSISRAPSTVTESDETVTEWFAVDCVPDPDSGETLGMGR